MAPAPAPDVVLMDIRMPSSTASRRRGSSPTRRRGRRRKILILTTFDLDEYVFDALRAGASGFLLKDAPTRGAASTPISGRRRRRALLAPSVTRRFLDVFAGSPKPPRERAGVLGGLTAAEVKVLTLVGKGLSNQEIASELFVADTTVRTHLRHIFEKLELRDRVQAVVLAYDTGLVLPTPR